MCTIEQFEKKRELTSVCLQALSVQLFETIRLSNTRTVASDAKNDVLNVQARQLLETFVGTGSKGEAADRYVPFAKFMVSKLPGNNALQSLVHDVTLGAVTEVLPHPTHTAHAPFMEFFKAFVKDTLGSSENTQHRQVMLDALIQIVAIATPMIGAEKCQRVMQVFSEYMAAWFPQISRPDMCGFLQPVATELLRNVSINRDDEKNIPAISGLVQVIIQAAEKSSDSTNHALSDFIHMIASGKDKKAREGLLNVAKGRGVSSAMKKLISQAFEKHPSKARVVMQNNQSTNKAGLSISRAHNEQMEIRAMEYQGYALQIMSIANTKKPKSSSQNPKKRKLQQSAHERSVARAVRRKVSVTKSVCVCLCVYVSC
jgi:hypothetical protein